MSAPVKHDDSSSDPRLYAPPWARERPLPVVGKPQTIHSPPVASALEEPEPVDLPRMPKGGPNIPWAPSAQPQFAGDLAIRALRRRLTLEPDVVPEPPLMRARESNLPWLTRLGVMFLAAGTVAFGVTVITSSEVVTSFKLNGFESSSKGDRVVTASYGAAPAPSASEHVDDAARLLVEGRQVPANEPLPLGVSLQGASGNEIVLLNGLAPGTRLTAGAPVGTMGWRLAARELGSVFAYAPRDYIGAMAAAIDLRSAKDRLLDSQIVRLEWTAKEPVVSSPPRVPVQRLDPDEIGRLIKRGQQYLQTGDIASARLMFRRAADEGSAPAALALGATFDPLILREIGVLGLGPNVAQARSWYQKAAELGSNEAARRIEQLGNPR